jgi:hypothetical protein
MLRFLIAGWILADAGLSASARAPCCPLLAETCYVPAPVQCLTPQTVIEKQIRTVTRYRNENRERRVTVYRQVPETKTVNEEYTVMVPQSRSRTVDVTVKQPVAQNIELRTTTMTPFTDTRQTTQTVCRMIPVQQERTVCEVVYPGCPQQSPAAGSPSTENRPRDPFRNVAYTRTASDDRDPNAPPPANQPANQSSANQSPSGAACESCGTSACGTCTACCPQFVRRVVKVTCMQPISEQQTVEYPVTRFEPSVQARAISYNLLEPRTETRVEEYTVDVPEMRTRTREVTVMRTVPVEKKEQYQVTVPYKQRIEVSVPCVRWVPAEPPPPADCGGCR